MIDEMERTEVDRNFAAFQKELPRLMETHQGKFVVMHKTDFVEYFDTLGDAIRFAKAKFPTPNDFSIQEVTTSNVNLGFYSYAMRPDSVQPDRSST